jgi:hypothetical protein
VVLFFDEIDVLRGQSLISVLRQRPAGFPASVILCGLRDVRDYKAASGGDPNRLGTASPFNIKLTSLRLGDFIVAKHRNGPTDTTPSRPSYTSPGSLTWLSGDADAPTAPVA